MSSKHSGSIVFHSVKGRLTLLSAAVFAVGMLLAFAYLHRSLSQTLLSRVDRMLYEELNEFASIYADGGIEAIRREIALEAAAGDRVFFRVANSQGRELASSDLSNWGEAPFTLLRDPPDLTAHPYLETVPLSGAAGGVRCVAGPIGPDTIVTIGYTLADNAELLGTVRERFMTVLAVMFALCVLSAWVLVRRALSGVEAITRTAARIGPSDLTDRVNAGAHGTEIDRLAEAFNTMLDRIQTLVNEIKEITENIAHELRSPIARMRGASEVTLLGDASIDEYREMTGSIVEECDGLLALVNAMLDIAEMEAGVARIEFEPVDLARMARDTCEFFAPAAEDYGVTLDVSTVAPAVVPGNGRKLRQALANLVDNALKYTPRGGCVSVSVQRNGHHALIVVQDTGTGIEQEDLSKIFDRFYRADRGRREPGRGLGLGLARAIARAHGGRIDVVSTPGSGTIFTVILPATEV